MLAAALRAIGGQAGLDMIHAFPAALTRRCCLHCRRLGISLHSQTACIWTFQVQRDTREWTEAGFRETDRAQAGDATTPAAAADASAATSRLAS